MSDIRSAFVQELMQAAERDQKIAAVVNDSLSSSRLGPFAEQFPKQLFNVGIAEQNMVGFAAGLAAGGMLPWACSATCFLSYRALEQIKNDIAYSGHNVKLVGNTTGLDYGPLGATHHALEDLGVLRALPRFTVIIPADHLETAQATQALLNHDGPAYLRLYRSKVPHDLGLSGTFEVGKVRVVQQGTDCTIFANGSMVAEALQASKILAEQGIKCGVVNVSTLSPFDTSGVVNAAASTELAVTVEEHSLHGGLGDAVCSALSQHNPMHVLKIGTSDFSINGSADRLREYYDLTAQGIAHKVQDSFKTIV